jgi:hypothetical protein
MLADYLQQIRDQIVASRVAAGGRTDQDNLVIIRGVGVVGQSGPDLGSVLISLSAI